MADIQKYIPIMKEFEGGFVDCSNDSGGATNAGVTLKTFQHFFGDNKTVEDLKAMTNEQLGIVIKSYWDAVSGDNITDQQIANCIADWGYNAGAVTAIKEVQRVIVGGCPITGFMGNITLGKINQADAETLCNLIVAARVDFYNQVVVEQPKDAEFLSGWLRRANFFSYKPAA